MVVKLPQGNQNPDESYLVNQSLHARTQDYAYQTSQQSNQDQDSKSPDVIRHAKGMFPSQSQITNGNDPDQPTNKTQGENKMNVSIYDAGEHQEPDSAVLIRDSYELKKSSKLQNTDPNSEADCSPASQTIKAGRKHLRRFTMKESKESTSKIGRAHV